MKKGLRSEYEHKTRKGTRIFKQPKMQGGEVVKWSLNYLFMVKRNGKQYTFSVGPNKKSAGKFADEISSFIKSPGRTPEAALKEYFPDIYKQRYTQDDTDKRTPTIGELILDYTENYTKDRESTKKQNVRMLRRIGGFILGLPTNTHEKRTVIEKRNKQIDALSISKITTSKLSAFKMSLLNKVKDDKIAHGRARTTCNSYMRGAGQLFSDKVVKTCYDDFKLPPNPFKSIDKEEEPTHKYESTVNIDELLQSAHDELSEDDKPAYIAFLLALHGGLSNSEMDKLLWEQIYLEESYIKIVTTKFYRSKRKKREAKVRLPPKVISHLTAYREVQAKEQTIIAMNQPDFVFPGYDAKSKIRCDTLFRRLSKWLRKHGITGSKSIYVLRKEAGSFIYKSTGSIDRASEFLRNSPQTAKEHYVDADEKLVVNFESEY